MPGKEVFLVMKRFAKSTRQLTFAKKPVSRSVAPTRLTPFSCAHSKVNLMESLQCFTTTDLLLLNHSILNMVSILLSVCRLSGHRSGMELHLISPVKVWHLMKVLLMRSMLRKEFARLEE